MPQSTGPAPQRKAPPRIVPGVLDPQVADISASDTKKFCASCGKDVTHRGRIKTSQGKYLCSKCGRSKRKRTRHSVDEHVLRRRQRVFGVVVGLIVIGAVLAVLMGL